MFAIDPQLPDTMLALSKVISSVHNAIEKLRPAALDPGGSRLVSAGRDAQVSVNLALSAAGLVRSLDAPNRWRLSNALRKACTHLKRLGAESGDSTYHTQFAMRNLRAALDLARDDLRAIAAAN